MTSGKQPVNLGRRRFLVTTVGAGAGLTLGMHLAACSREEKTTTGAGPGKAGGEVVAINDDLVGNPSLANEDPYDAGWLVILKPEEWDSVVGSLVKGADVTAPYEAKMDSEGFAGCA